MGTGSRDNDLMSESSGFVSSERGMHMDVVLDMREDPTEEVPESSSSAKVGYDWVA